MFTSQANSQYGAKLNLWTKRGDNHDTGLKPSFHRVSLYELTMTNRFTKKELLNGLKQLSEWLQNFARGQAFDLTIVGEAALVLSNLTENCDAVDVLTPQPLPNILQKGSTVVARSHEIHHNWLHTDTAKRLSVFSAPTVWPMDFEKTQTTLRVGKNIVLLIPCRQTLISLLVFVTTRTHTSPLHSLLSVDPTMSEIDHALQFVRSIDNSPERTEQFRYVLSNLEFSRETMEGMF